MEHNQLFSILSTLEWTPIHTGRRGTQWLAVMVEQTVQMFVAYEWETTISGLFFEMDVAPRATGSPRHPFLFYSFLL